MSLRNYIEELEHTQSMGMDTTSPISTINPGFVLNASNFNLGLNGGYEKRTGYSSVLTTPWTGRNIIAGFDYAPASGPRQIIVHGVNATDGVLGIAGSSVTPILSGLSTARPSLVQFDNLLFFFNGLDVPKVYDGTTTRQVGITAPAAAPSSPTQATGGNLVLTGSYIWFYTYYNSVTGAESSPSAGLKVLLTGSNNKVTFTITAGVAATADTIRIYRTYANFTAAFLEDSIAITSTSYTSTKLDTALTDPIDFDNSRITTFTSTANYAQVADSRIFVSSGPNEVRWSKMGFNGTMPESFMAQSFVDCVGKFGAGDRIVGLGRTYNSQNVSQARSMIIVMKDRSIGRLERFDAGSPLSPSDPTFYLYNEISDQIGAVSHWAGCSVKNDWVWLGKDNIYSCDGYNVRSIADPIQRTIMNTDFTKASSTSAINDTKNQRVLISVEIDGKPIVLVGDYRAYPNYRWTIYTAGIDIATHPGIKAGCFFHVDNANSLVTYFGNASLNGKLYKMDGSTSDDGLGIYGQLITRPYACTKPLNTKLFKIVNSTVEGSGNNYNLQLSSIYDMSGIEEDRTSFSLYSGNAVYDTALYDVDTYSASSVVSIKQNLHRKAVFMQIVFRQTDAAAPVTIFTWGSSASFFKVA